MLPGLSTMPTCQHMCWKGTPPHAQGKVGARFFSPTCATSTPRSSSLCSSGSQAIAAASAPSQYATAALQGRRGQVEREGDHDQANPNPNPKPRVTMAHRFALLAWITPS